jgi:hypothetical protein
VDLEADLALLIELGDCRVATVTIEDGLGQGVDRWAEALRAVLLLDVLEELQEAEALRERRGDRALGLGEGEGDALATTNRELIVSSRTKVIFMATLLLLEVSSSEVLELDLRRGNERQRYVDSGDKRMAQSLQRCEPLGLVNLEDLLDKVDELKDLDLLLVLVLKVEGDEAVVLVILGELPLLNHVLLALLFAELGDVVVLKELREVVVLVIVHRLFDFVLHVWGHHGPHEVVEGLEYISLLLQIVVKEPLTVLAVKDHVLVRLAAELQDLQQLVVVVLAREDRDLDEHFDRRARQGPHVDALVVEGYGLAHLTTEDVVRRVFLAAHQDFRSSVVA